MKWGSVVSRVGHLAELLRRIIYTKWFGIVVLVCLAAGTVLWFVVQEKVPVRIQIATGAKGGQYHRYGNVLGDSIQRRTGRSVEVQVTDGSVDNHRRLAAGNADLAIVQNGAVPMAGLAVVAPLYQDVVQVIVRKGRGIETLHDLAGKNVVLGPKGSGMRRSALEVLGHYGVKAETLGKQTESYFMELADDQTLDAAIVTTGYGNADLNRLLASGEFGLLSVDDAEAISMRHAHFAMTTIPRGLYREGPPVPDRPTKTVTTTAILVASNDVPAPLVEEVVAALYEDYPHWVDDESRRQLSPLMTASEARQWQQLPLHQVTQTYFEPYKGLVLLKDFMESLVATKDLLFAMGAGIYVLWLWRRKVAQQKAQAELAAHKRKLNALLDETIRIESEQMNTDDPQQLRVYLDEVTRIKLRALDRLTDEALRGDQMFTIFLVQCSNLSRKIQSKIGLASTSER